MVLDYNIHNSLKIKGQAKEVLFGYPNLERLVDDLWETMYYHKLIALTALQVGIPLKIVIVDNKEISNKNKRIKRLMLNLAIIDSPLKSNYSLMQGEYPGYSGDTQIRIKYFDNNFVEHHELFTGVLGRVLHNCYNNIEGWDFISVFALMREQLKSNLKNYDFTLSY